MAKRPLPTPEELRQLLRYEPETGKLFWRRLEGSDLRARKWNGRWAGREAFTAYTAFRHKQGQVMGRHTLAHRVIWAMVHNQWPRVIDHKDGNPSNNRIENLRDVLTLVNVQNSRVRIDSRSGVRGVAKKRGRWFARIKVRGQELHLGTFDQPEAALAARKNAEIYYWGEGVVNV